MKKWESDNMIKLLAKKLIDIIFETSQNIETYDVHCYGVEIIISTLLDFSLILLAGYYFNNVIDVILYFIIFALIRKFSGGYHCSTYLTCLSLHLFLFVIYILTFTYYQKMIFYFQIISLLIITILSPIKNRELPEKQYFIYKLISIFLSLILIIIANLNMFTNIITYTLFIVSILMVVFIINEKFAKATVS